MFAFSENDLDQLHNASVSRQNELFDEFARDNADRVVADICKILNKDAIMKRMLQGCKEHVNPWDLKIGIYGYNGKRKMGRFTLDDVINSRHVLYKLDDMFNGECPHGGHRFRVTTRRMRDGPAYGWYEIMLHYYRGGVPVKLIREDPDMPPLETGHEVPLPASPIPVMNPEDDEEYEESVHNGGCCCRDCRQRKY